MPQLQCAWTDSRERGLVVVVVVGVGVVVVVGGGGGVVVVVVGGVVVVVVVVVVLVSETCARGRNLCHKCDKMRHTMKDMANGHKYK